MLTRNILATAFLLLSSPAFASENTGPDSPWNMSVTQFRQALDKAIKADVKNGTDASTRNCKQDRKDRSVTVCSFADGTFQKSVEEFKKLDLVDGKFTQKVVIRIKTTNDKVSEVYLSGDRADPMNMFTFIGVALNVFQVFDPKIVETDEGLRKVREDLGLMRGDNAEDIGKPKTIIEPWGIILCLTMPSKISTEVACLVRPRS